MATVWKLLVRCPHTFGHNVYILTSKWRSEHSWHAYDKKKNSVWRVGGQEFTYFQDTCKVDSHCDPAESQKDSHVLTESSFQVGGTVMGSQSHTKALKEHLRKQLVTDAFLMKNRIFALRLYTSKLFKEIPLLCWIWETLKPNTQTIEYYYY